MQYRSDGFDAGVYIRLPANITWTSKFSMRFGRKFFRWPERYAYSTNLHRPPDLAGNTLLPCVYPNWDNTPRSGRRGLVITGSSPQRFKTHIRHAIRSLEPMSYEHRLLWVKSWNEWAEGNYLEPDLEHGRGYLEALADEVAIESPR
jgi:hypothetical protein